MNENHMIGIPTPFIASQGIIRDEKKKNVMVIEFMRTNNYFVKYVRNTY